MKSLFLYEEIMLLALRDEEGTFSSGFVEYAVAGAILSELFLDKKIGLGGKRGDLVDHDHPPGTGDPIIDESLEKITEAKRRATVKNWVSRLSRIPKLRQKVARRLCQRGIVRAEEDRILFLFPRTVYPEINPKPEREIIERLKDSIFGKELTSDPRTVALISLARGTNLLESNLGREEIRDRKERIEELTAGETIGAAARDIMATGDAIASIAAMIPALIAGTASS